MSLSTFEQIKETIQKSNRILIAFKKNPNGDTIASALALYFILRKMGKIADIVSDGFVLPKNFEFLPEAKKINPILANLKKITVSFDLENNKINDFSYDIKDNKLNIFITPESSLFDARKVTTSSSDFKYDLIITVDTYDLESLGKVFDQNTEFFFNLPIINIDHSPDNDHFGQINSVEITATSTAEIIFNLLEAIDPKFLDEDIATCLLTGMIVKTKSFKTNQVTPRSLNIASQLIATGGKREKIIQNLYRTRSIATLKIWGKILARIRNDSAKKLVWSLLEKKDFDEVGIGPDCLPDVIEELIANTPESEIIILFYETSLDHVSGLVYTSKNHDAMSLLKPFNPDGTRNLAYFSLKGKSLLEAQREVITKVRERLENMI
jgi:phosphoesterase RecJ-like protein